MNMDDKILHNLMNLSGKVAIVTGASRGLGQSMARTFCASRGGVLQLTKSLAAEWGPFGINVNVIAPGWLRTEQTEALYRDKKWVLKFFKAAAPRPEVLLTWILLRQEE